MEICINRRRNLRTYTVECKGMQKMKGAEQKRQQGHKRGWVRVKNDGIQIVFRALRCILMCPRHFLILSHNLSVVSSMIILWIFHSILFSISLFWIDQLFPSSHISVFTFLSPAVMLFWLFSFCACRFCRICWLSCLLSSQSLHIFSTSKGHWMLCALF